MESLPDDIFPDILSLVVSYTPVRDHEQIMCALSRANRRWNCLLADPSVVCRVFSAICGGDSAFALTCLLRFPRWVRSSRVVLALAGKANQWTHDFVTGCFVRMADTSNHHTRALSQLLAIGLQHSEEYMLPRLKGDPIWTDRQFDPSLLELPYQVVLAYHYWRMKGSPRCPFLKSSMWEPHSDEFWRIYGKQMSWWDAIALVEQQLMENRSCPRVEMFTTGTHLRLCKHIQKVFVKDPRMALSAFWTYPDFVLEVLPDAAEAVHQALADFAVPHQEPKHLARLLRAGLRLRPTDYELAKLWLYDRDNWEVLGVFRKKLACLVETGHEIEEGDFPRFLSVRSKRSLRSLLRDVIAHHPYPLRFASPTLITRLVKQISRQVPRGIRKKLFRIVFETIGLLLIVHRWDARAPLDEAIIEAVGGTPHHCLLSLDWERIDDIKAADVASITDDLGRPNGSASDKCRKLLGTLWSQLMQEREESWSWSSDDSD